MKKKKGLKGKLIAAGIALAVIAAIAVAAMGGAAVVSLAPAEQGAVEKFITETGSIQARDSVAVSGKAHGQIAALLVSEGDAVAEGQLLASYAADGTTESLSADINGIRAQVAGLQAQLYLAKDLAARNNTLYEEGAVSFDEYNNAVTAVSQIESQIAALNHTIAGLSASLSELSGAQGVAAPIAGTVTAVWVREGEIVSPGVPLLEIADITNIYVEANLIAEDADALAEGNHARVFSESERLIDENAVVSKIFVSARDVMSDLGILQKRVPVEITLSSEKTLRLGSDVNLEIVAERKEHVLRIPESALFEINREHHVYLVEGNRAKLQKIEVGLVGGRYAEVLEGLSPGDLVITSPAAEIEDGKAVKAAN